MEAGSWWQAALWAAAGGAVALGATLLFRDPEPARTALELVELACGANNAAERLRQQTKHVAPRLHFEIDRSGEYDGEPSMLERMRAGLSPQPTGAHDPSTYFELSQTELSLKLAELNALSPHCQLSLHDYSVHDGNDGSEWLEGDLDYSDSQPGDLHAERRRLRAQFRQTDGVVRLERLKLGPIRRHIPEARP